MSLCGKCELARSAIEPATNLYCVVSSRINLVSIELPPNFFVFVNFVATCTELGSLDRKHRRGSCFVNDSIMRLKVLLFVP